MPSPPYNHLAPRLTWQANPIAVSHLLSQEIPALLHVLILKHIIDTQGNATYNGADAR